jgi:hypothetical protein
MLFHYLYDISETYQPICNNCRQVRRASADEKERCVTAKLPYYSRDELGLPVAQCFNCGERDSRKLQPRPDLEEKNFPWDKALICEHCRAYQEALRQQARRRGKKGKEKAKLPDFSDLLRPQHVWEPNLYIDSSTLSGVQDVVSSYLL